MFAYEQYDDDMDLQYTDDVDRFLAKSTSYWNDASVNSKVTDADQAFVDDMFGEIDKVGRAGVSRPSKIGNSSEIYTNNALDDTKDDLQSYYDSYDAFAKDYEDVMENYQEPMSSLPSHYENNVKEAPNAMEYNATYDTYDDENMVPDNRNQDYNAYDTTVYNNDYNDYNHKDYTNTYDDSEATNTTYNAMFGDAYTPYQNANDVDATSSFRNFGSPSSNHNNYNNGISRVDQWMEEYRLKEAKLDYQRDEKLRQEQEVYHQEEEARKTAKEKSKKQYAKLYGSVQRQSGDSMMERNKHQYTKMKQTQQDQIKTEQVQKKGQTNNKNNNTQKAMVTKPIASEGGSNVQQLHTANQANKEAQRVLFSLRAKQRLQQEKEAKSVKSVSLTNPQDTLDRMAVYSQKKEQKLEQLRQELEKQQIGTFTPQMNAESRKIAQESLGNTEFLQRQEQYRLQARERQQDLTAKLTPSFEPVLVSKSVEILRQKDITHEFVSVRPKAVAETFSFTPQQNPVSIALSKSVHSEAAAILQQVEEVVPVAEKKRLYIPKKSIISTGKELPSTIQQAITTKQAKLEHYDALRQSKEAEGCTFAPKVNPLSTEIAKHNIGIKAIQRNDDLFKEYCAKHRHQAPVIREEVLDPIPFKATEYNSEKFQQTTLKDVKGIGSYMATLQQSQQLKQEEEARRRKVFLQDLNQRRKNQPLTSQKTEYYTYLSTSNTQPQKQSRSVQAYVQQQQNTHTFQPDKDKKAQRQSAIHRILEEFE